MGRMSEEPEDFEGPWSMCQATLREAGMAYPRTCQRCGLGPCQRGKQITIGVDLASGPDKTAIDPAPNHLVPRVSLEWALSRVDPRTEAGVIVGGLVNEVRVLRERVDAGTLSGAPQEHWSRKMAALEAQSEADPTAPIIAPQQGEVARLREALHQISLCSQNSMGGRYECGRIARRALEGASDATN